MIQTFVGELQTLAFRHRSALILPFAAPIVVAAVTRGGWPAREELLLGLILAVAGVWLRLWALRAIGKRARVQRAGARELLAQGPYARVRNPLYLANTSIAVGLAILAGAGLASVGICSGFFVVYSLVVRHEERALAGTFGASYETYVRTVPRWLPRLRPAAGRSSEPCAWRDIFARERGLLGVPLAGLAIVGTRTGVLPIRSIVETAAAASQLTSAVIVGVAFLLASGLNAVAVERSFRRHAARRSDAGEAAEVSPPSPVVVAVASLFVGAPVIGLLTTLSFTSPQSDACSRLSRDLAKSAQRALGASITPASILAARVEARGLAQAASLGPVTVAAVIEPRASGGPQRTPYVVIEVHAGDCHAGFERSMESLPSPQDLADLAENGIALRDASLAGGGR